MSNHRPALPLPPQALRDQKLAENDRSAAKTLIRQLDSDKENLLFQLAIVESRLQALHDARFVYGHSIKSKVALAWIKNGNLLNYSRAVGRLRWQSTLSDKFTGPGRSPGNVSGVLWANSALIANNLLLTTGHAIDQTGAGWERPSRAGEVLRPDELAKLLSVSFILPAADSKSEPQEISLPVLELVNYRPDGLDYAVLKFKSTPDMANWVFSFPGKISTDAVESTENNAYYLLDPGSEACDPIIQKVVGLQINQHQITYTLDGPDKSPSGTPLVSLEGNILGIKIAKGQALRVTASS